MGIVGFIRGYLHRKHLKLRCWWNGHSSLTLIEEYSKRTRLKIFSGRHLEKLSMGPVRLEYLIQGKVRCGACGCIFLGNIVKVGENGHFHRRA